MGWWYLSAMLRAYASALALVCGENGKVVNCITLLFVWWLYNLLYGMDMVNKVVQMFGSYKDKSYIVV